MARSTPSPPDARSSIVSNTRSTLIEPSPPQSACGEPSWPRRRTSLAWRCGRHESDANARSGALEARYEARARSSSTACGLSGYELEHDHGIVIVHFEVPCRDLAQVSTNRVGHHYCRAGRDVCDAAGIAREDPAIAVVVLTVGITDEATPCATACGFGSCFAASRATSEGSTCSTRHGFVGRFVMSPRSSPGGERPRGGHRGLRFRVQRAR